MLNEESGKLNRAEGKMLNEESGKFRPRIEMQSSRRDALT